MFWSTLDRTIKKLLSTNKGILAADESYKTIEKRFSKIHLISNFENRRDYRELLFSTKNLEKYISGVILFQETFFQINHQGIDFRKILKQKSIVIGIKVDEGLDILNKQEKITRGLAGLDYKLKMYYKLGARFAKWRAVFVINKHLDLPSDKAILLNAKNMAVYALACQKNGLVPIIEPEVLAYGNHSLNDSYQATKKVLLVFFQVLQQAKVDLKRLLLKVNMITPGLKTRNWRSDKIAKYTLKCLQETVPEIVPGIVFLSGGQAEEQARKNLAKINKLNKTKHIYSFSFGRALQNSALYVWHGKTKNIKIAQQRFLKTCRLMSKANQGKIS